MTEPHLLARKLATGAGKTTVTAIAKPSLCIMRPNMSDRIKFSGTTEDNYGAAASARANVIPDLVCRFHGSNHMPSREEAVDVAVA
jgi:hypothetical protein